MEQKKLIQIKLKIELFNRLQSAAALDNRSMTNFITKLIRDKLDREEKP